MSLNLTPDSLAILLEFDDETFLQLLTDVMASAPDDETDFSLLFHPEVLLRLVQAKASVPDKWHGVFLPTLRRTKTLYYPDLEQKMAEVAAAIVHDPYAWTDVRTLLEIPALPVRWLVPGLIPDGLTLLGGTPKSGKSYLAYTLALAVASTGQWAGHFEVDPGRVLFISLEDDEDDTRQRLAEIAPDCAFSPQRLMFLHGQDALPGFQRGLHAWLGEALTLYKPRLVIIDPVSYLYSARRGPSSLFEETKDMLFPLRWLAKQHHCALVCLDHRRKRSKDDVSVFDTLHGSQAKVAVADAILMVERTEQTVTMQALLRRGRDQTHFFDMAFSEGRMWCTYKGSGTDATHTQATYGDIRLTVMRTLWESDVPLTLREIALAAELPTDTATKDNLWQILQRLVKSREAVRVGRGCYAKPTQDQE